MENAIHLISGLPRSGSTLLSAILRQNPAFHAAKTSPATVLFDTNAPTSREHRTGLGPGATPGRKLAALPLGPGRPGSCRCWMPPS